MLLKRTTNYDPNELSSLQESKETKELLACLASLAGRGPWEMLDLEDPPASVGSQDHQVYLGQLSLAQKETEAFLAQEEVQVEGFLSHAGMKVTFDHRGVLPHINLIGSLFALCFLHPSYIPDSHMQ